MAGHTANIDVTSEGKAPSPGIMIWFQLLSNKAGCEISDYKSKY